MPVGVVTNAREEHKWERAKQIAADEGHEKDWQYIMGIYKRMNPNRFKQASFDRYYNKYFNNIKYAFLNGQAQPVPQPVVQPMPRPVAQPIPRFAAKPMPRPVAQPVARPVAPVLPAVPRRGAPIPIQALGLEDYGSPAVAGFNPSGPTGPNLRSYLFGR